ncbi:MAG: hypothetical protein LIO59_05245 [Oscillospiraceae bacterium]|nr:hypothetical protein [Oscillospiraceae bacterium]
MVKKLVAVMLAFVAASTVAFADGITGTLNEGIITIDTNDKDRLILNGYDDNGILQYSGLFTAENDRFEIPAELTQYSLRACFVGEGFFDVDIEEQTEQPVQTAEPVQTEEPAATSAPTSELEATDAPQKFPSIYEREVDAVNAFAVVDKISSGLDDDEEEVYYADVLYQGSEMTVPIKQDVLITSASDAFSYMEGLDAGALKEGDVVFLAANLSGDVSSIGFIYRPQENNIVTDGNDYGDSFLNLISDNGKVAGQSGWSVLRYGGSSSVKYQFAFGVIKDKSANTLTLLGPDGDENNEMYLTLESNTIVYICDMSAKREVSIGSVSNITKSSIPKSVIDDNGIVTYSDSFKTNYALARLVNGTVTDIVIYTNYNK